MQINRKSGLRSNIILSITIAVFIAIGFYVTHDQSELNIIEYYSCALISVCSILFYFGQRNILRINNIHFNIIIFIYIFGYYIKYFIMVYYFKFEFENFLLNFPAHLNIISNKASNIKYIETITIGLISIVFTSYILNKYVIIKNYKTALNFKVNSNQIYLILLITLLTSIICIIIINSYNLGNFVDIEIQKPAPFRVGGFVWAIYGGLVPLVLMILYHINSQGEKKWIYIFLIIIYIIFSSLLTTSKATLYGFTIMIILVQYQENKIIPNMIPFLFIIILSPFLSDLMIKSRYLRLTDSGFNITEGYYNILFNKSIIESYLPADNNSAANILDLIIKNLNRINGADSLIYIIDFFQNDTNTLIKSISPTLIYNDVILNSGSETTTFSPSMLGYFYLQFGNQFWVMLCAYLIFWHLVFYVLKRYSGYSNLVFISIFSIVLARFTSEGTFENFTFVIFGTFLAVIFGMMLSRFLLPR